MKRFVFLVVLALFCACGLVSTPRDRLGTVSSSFSVVNNYASGGYVGDLVTWSDSFGKTRTAYMVNPTTTADPGGAFGGYARTMTYTLASGTVRTANHGATAPGAGFVTTQRGSDYTIFSSRFTASGSRTVVAQGSDNFTVRYQWATLKNQGATITVNVKATVDWTFLSGKDHPIVSVTHDTSAYSAGGYSGSAQSPSGDLEYSDVSTHTVDVVGWGDKWKFTTTSSPVSFGSTWTYNVANTVPYLTQANNTANAELGLVQTQNYSQHDAGQGQFQDNWNKTSSTRVVDGNGEISSQLMPVNWNWTQLENQWYLPGNNTSKPWAFIMNYGAVGTNTGTKYTGGTIAGYPYQSYATTLTLGIKGTAATNVTDIEAAMGATLSASVGTVATSGPGGAGRTDTVTYSPSGYNAVYSTFDFTPNGSGVVVGSMGFGAKTFKHPVLRLLGKTSAPAVVHYDGAAQTAGTDYIASVDATSSSVWLVLMKNVTGTHSFGIDDGVDAGTDSGNDSGSPWTGVTVTPNQNVGGYTSDVYAWQDATNQLRTISLVHNDAVDPSGFYGGYARQGTYVSGGSTITMLPRTLTSDQPGWGYTLHHQNGGADSTTLSSRRATGTFRTVFAGRHHAMHEYAYTLLNTQGPPIVGWNVATTIRWMVSTGNNQILWAHTVDMNGIAANALYADDRSPVGEWNFDGVESSLSGLGWGDHYKLRTTSSPATMNSTWDYTVANTVPHTIEWVGGIEQGVIQTEGWATKDASYGWFYNNWGHTSANRVIDGSGEISSQLMPVDWNWTYQLTQYNLEAGDPNSKRLAWGVNFGSVGQSTYSRFGNDINLSGYPLRSSSHYYTVGATGGVGALVTQVENALAAGFTASVGTVATTGPYGVGAGTSQTYSNPGYDPVYGAWTVTAASNAAHVQWVTPGGLTNPIVRVLAYTGGAPSVTLNGTTLTADVDYFASPVTYDGGNELWITVNRSLAGTATLNVN